MVPGEVHHLDVRFPGGSDSMPKFLVCIDPDQCLFMIINTKPPLFPQAGVMIGPADMGFLAHDSFIDTSGLHDLNQKSLSAAITQGGTSRGILPRNIRDAIKETVKAHGILTLAQESLVLSNL